MLTVPQRYGRRDRRTDVRTTYDSNTALALRASRGKKLQIFGKNTNKKISYRLETGRQQRISL